MGMRMAHRLVLVGMRVAVARGERRIMPMPVVLVMLMVVLVRERDVAMPVLVTLAQVQPYPRGHQQAGSAAPKRASPGQLSTMAPATIKAMPSAMRRAKFSFNPNHARNRANAPSPLTARTAPPPHHLHT